MALPTQLTLAQFFDGLPIQTLSFDLSEAMESNETEGGEVLTADIGPRLWTAELTLRFGTYAEMERIKARLSLMRQAGRTLLAHSLPICYPQADPRGLLLGSYNPQIASVNVNNRDMTFKNLPPGYKLSQGDFFSYIYSGRYAMHQIASDSTANGSGIATVECSTFIRAGWSIDTPIVLRKPFFKAKVIPGSTKPGRSGQTKTDGVSFAITQTLGA